MKTRILIPFAAISIFATSQVFAEKTVWKRHTIDASDKETGKLGADGVRLSDINGDGFQDVVTGWENGDAIRVCLNPGPEKAKEIWPGVTVGRVAGAEDAVFADLDGDGFQDVITSTEGKTKTVFVHWSPADKSALLDSSKWTTATVPASKGKEMWMYALPFDVNEDGNLDVILGSKVNGSVSWLRNPGKDSARDLKAWKLVKLAEAAWIMSLVKVDLDGNCVDDLVYSDRKGENSGVFWMKKLPEAPWFEEKKLLGLSGEEVMFLDIVDLNKDKKLDVAAAVRPDKIEYLYQPASDVFSKWETGSQAGGVPAESFGGSKAVRFADMELDGVPDIVITCEQAKGKLSGTLMVTYHPGALFGELAHRDISGPEGIKYDRLELIDLDADGDLDIMTCEERANLGVFWYENPAK